MTVSAPRTCKVKALTSRDILLAERGMAVEGYSAGLGRPPWLS